MDHTFNISPHSPARRRPKSTWTPHICLQGACVITTEVHRYMHPPLWARVRVLCRTWHRLALGPLCVLAIFAATTGSSHADSRGLLASPGFAGQPVKGLYFFPGETRDTSLYTANPANPVDEHWLSDPTS